MIPLLFANAMPSDGAQMWQVVTAMSALAALGLTLLTLVRGVSGKANERQIEPTQLAAIQAELKAQTTAIQVELKAQTTALSRIETSGVATATHVENLQREVTHLRTEIKDTETKAFQRINAISAESTATRARVDGLERRENQK